MKRVKWLDWAAVLAMACVVWFHIPSQAELPIYQVEFAVVNILFFLISGVTFTLSRSARDSYSSFFKSRWHSLGIPTLSFFVMFYVLWLIFGRKMAADIASWYVPLMELATGSLKTVLATYWFVFCLFAIQLLYFLLSRFIRNKNALLTVCGLLPLITMAVKIPNCFQLNNALIFMPFFAMGVGLAPSLMGENEKQKGWLPLLGMALCVVISVLVPTRTFALDWMQIMAGLVMAGLLLLVSKLLGRKADCPQWVTLLRYGALLLLATQNYIIGMGKVLLDRMTGEVDFLAHHFALKPLMLLAVYAVAFPLILGAKHYAPWLLGLKKKNE